MLSRLRNLDNKIEKLLEDMPISYDITKDTLYHKGIEKGITSSIVGFHKIGIPIEKIALAVNLPVEKIQAIIADWEKTNA